MNIELTIKSASYQKFTDLISFYQNTIKQGLNKLNNNIEIYNNKADENGWKYKLKSYKEAINYFSTLYNSVISNIN